MKGEQEGTDGARMMGVGIQSGAPVLVRDRSLLG